VDIHPNISRRYASPLAAGRRVFLDLLLSVCPALHILRCFVAIFSLPSLFFINDSPISVFLLLGAHLPAFPGQAQGQVSPRPY